MKNKKLHIIDRDDMKCFYAVEQNKIIIPVNEKVFNTVCKII